MEEVFGGQICLDPASSSVANTQVQAQFYFDGTNADGLEMSWRIQDVLQWSANMGGITHTPSQSWSVFLNPPYGRRDGKTGPYNMPLWIDKAISEYRAGNITEAIILVNVFPAQSWWKPLWQCPICFVDHRIHFIMPETMLPKPNPTQASAFVYMGPNHAKFWQVFYRFGPVVRAMDDPDIPEWVICDSVKTKEDSNET